MAKLQIIVLFSLTILLTLFFEKSKAFPETWDHRLIINRRPELYYDAEIIDKAYRLCWMELQKDVLTGRSKRSTHLRWRSMTGGRRYYLPYSERQKLSLGENCLLMKGIEIVKDQERMEKQKISGVH